VRRTTENPLLFVKPDRDQIMKVIKIGKRVKVEAPGIPPFEGEIVFSGEWENPFSVTRKKGVDYHVKADDNGETYGGIDDRHVTEIK